MDLLRGLNNEGMTIIMVTHNPECARYASKILRIADGLLMSEERFDKLLLPPDGSNGSEIRAYAGPAPL